MTDDTRTFSLTPGTPGRSTQKPRTIRSISTPACEAARSASQTPRSSSWFILAMIRAGRPARRWATSPSISARNRSRMLTGATSSLA